MTDHRFVRPGFDQALSHLIEEAGEVLAACGKLQRHGPLSVNPLLPVAEQETNIAWLWREMADLEGSLARLVVEIRARPDFSFLLAASTTEDAS
jgi:hypothetical protein